MLGADQIMYFPPSDHDRVLKYNPSTQNLSLIEESYGEEIREWWSGVLASFAAFLMMLTKFCRLIAAMSMSS